MKTTPCFYLVLVIGLLIGMKLTVSVLSRSYFLDVNRKNAEYPSSQEIFRQESYLQHSKNNKHNSYNNKNHDKWENTLAVMKLRQMILGNARKQIYVRTRFNL